ncbi:MAG: transglycosylase SLT domain-containing protein [Pseudomonadota bacterium]
MLLLGCIALAGCAMHADDRLESIVASGVIVAGGVPEPGRLTPAGFPPSGFDVDLVDAFAKQLGVTVRWHRFDDIQALLRAVAEGQLDLGLGVPLGTATDLGRVVQSPRYASVEPVVAYRRGNTRPRRFADLPPGRWLQPVDAPLLSPPRATGAKTEPGRAGSGALPALDVQAALAEVHAGRYAAAVTTRSQLNAMRIMFPALAVAFPVPQAATKDVGLAVALPRDAGQRFYSRLFVYLRDARINGRIERLRRRHSERLASMNQAALQIFARHSRERLPRFVSMFRAAARSTGLHWSELAALGYQESQWEPNAVSPTGVTGLMMLTRATARELGVTNRLDPAESIMAGSRYLARLYSGFADDVPSSERLWFAAAAYNLGRAHVRAALRAVSPPGTWNRVRRQLLEDGNASLARRQQAVTYVRRTRMYKDALQFASRRDSLRSRIRHD